MECLHNNKKALIFFLALSSILFYLINANIPMLLDDYWYNFIIGKAGQKGEIYFTSDRITSGQELLSTLYYFRYPKEGRLSNILIILIQYFGGKTLFNILNTLVMALFVLAASKLCFHRMRLAGVVTAITLIILLFPNHLFTVLWLSGSINYLWGALFLVLFLSVYLPYSQGKKRGKGFLAAGILCGILCGSLHEGLGIPLLIALFTHTAVARLRKQETGVPCILLFTSVLAGTFIALSAPGLWQRVGASNETLDFLGIARKIILFFYVTWLPSCLLLVSLWLKRRHLLDSFYPFLILPNFILDCAFGDSQSAAGGGGYFYYCLSVMLWVISLLREYIRRPSYIPVILMPINLLVLAATLFFYAGIGKIYKEAIIRGATEKIVTLDYFSLYRPVPKSLSLALAMGSEKGYEIYNYIGRFYGQQDFYVVFNTYINDKSIYDMFHGDRTDKAIAKRAGNLCIVRLPEGYLIPAYKGVVSMEDDSLPPLEMVLDDNLPLIVKVCYPIIGKRYSSYGRDYHEGFHYLILPEPANQYARATLMMKKEGATEATYASVDLPRPAAAE